MANTKQEMESCIELQDANVTTQQQQETYPMNQSQSLDEEIKSQAMNTVYEKAMKLESVFSDTKLHEPNWRLFIYWLHLWIIGILYAIGGKSTVSLILVVSNQ